jgi:hypothetical protein
MDMGEIVERVCAWEGVLTLRPGPGERTREQVLTLLQTAHAAPLARWQRRHDSDSSSG